MQKIYIKLTLFFLYLIVYDNKLTCMQLYTPIAMEKLYYDKNFLSKLQAQNERRPDFLSHYGLLPSNHNQNFQKIALSTPNLLPQISLNNNFIFNNQYAKTLHTPNKLFLCHCCNKNFKTQKALRIHENSHSKTYLLCDYPDCDKKYQSRSSLKKHKSLEHASEEEKKFACNCCTKKFVYQGLLNLHIKRVHNKKNQ